MIPEKFENFIRAICSYAGFPKIAGNLSAGNLKGLLL